MKTHNKANATDSLPLRLICDVMLPVWVIYVIVKFFGNNLFVGDIISIPIANLVLSYVFITQFYFIWWLYRWTVK